MPSRLRSQAAAPVCAATPPLTRHSRGSSRLYTVAASPGSTGAVPRLDPLRHHGLDAEADGDHLVGSSVGGVFGLDVEHLRLLGEPRAEVDDLPVGGSASAKSWRVSRASRAPSRWAGRRRRSRRARSPASYAARRPELGDGGGDAGQSARALRQGRRTSGSTSVEDTGILPRLAKVQMTSAFLGSLASKGSTRTSWRRACTSSRRASGARRRRDPRGSRAGKNLGAGAAALRLGVRDGRLRRVERARLVALVDGVVIQEARLRRRLDVGVLGTDGVEEVEPKADEADGGRRTGRGVVARQQRGDDDILVGARAERRREQQREREGNPWNRIAMLRARRAFRRPRVGIGLPRDRSW